MKSLQIRSIIASLSAKSTYIDKINSVIVVTIVWVFSMKAKFWMTCCIQRINPKFIAHSVYLPAKYLIGILYEYVFLFRTQKYGSTKGCPTWTYIETLKLKMLTKFGMLSRISNSVASIVTDEHVSYL